MNIEQFVEHHRKPVHALFRACRFPPAEANGLTQEAFRRCARTSLNLSELENTVREILSERGAESAASNPLARFVAASPGVVSLQPASLGTEIAALDPSARNALTLHYGQHASSAELSERFKRSPTAIRQLLARARESLAAGPR